MSAAFVPGLIPRLNLPYVRLDGRNRIAIAPLFAVADLAGYRMAVGATGP